MHKELNISKNEALNKCTALCSRTEYSIWEIRERLSKWGVDFSAQNEIVEYLCQNNYVNEARYVDCFVSDKLRFSKWGRVKIRYILRQKRVDEKLIYSAFESIDEELYFKTLKTILESKIRSKKGKCDISTKASVFNFALSRGFEPDLINRALKEILNCR